MNKTQIIEHVTQPVEYSVFDVKWVPSTAKFLAIGSNSNGTGVLQVFQMNENEIESVVMVNRPKAIKCCSFGASEVLGRSRVALGDFCGGLSVIDLECVEKPTYFIPDAHSDIINTLDAFGGNSMNCGAPEIVTGSRDGSVKVWDVRQPQVPVANISPAAEAEGGTGCRDCWAVTFGNSYNNAERLVAAGYDNGDLKFFDLRQMKTVFGTNVKNGICGLEFDRKDIKMNKLAAVTLEGGLHVFDTRTFHKTRGYACHSEAEAGNAVGSNGTISGQKSTIWAVKHLPQNRDIFVTCSGSGSVRLWKYNYPDKRSKPGPDSQEMGVAGSLTMLRASTLSTQPVNSFDWNADMEGLAVCGAFDQTIRVLITTRLNLQ